MANEGADPNVTHEPNHRYDVFLSFRGLDTRHDLINHLYGALCLKGVKVFMDDDELSAGDTISASLSKTIEESRISIVFFSQNYAYSAWCLDELVKILECMKLKNQQVCPIFYDVEPSDVRHQRNSYGEAMAEHERRFGNDSEKVQKWRSALIEITDLPGWHFRSDRNEDKSEFIERIVKKATEI